MRRVLHAALLIAVVALAAAIAYRRDELRGLLGCGIGAALGLLMSGLSHFFTVRVKAAGTDLMMKAVFASMVMSVFLLVTAIFATHFLWPEVVKPVALTALGVYLVHRFVEAFGSWPRPSAKIV